MDKLFWMSSPSPSLCLVPLTPTRRPLSPLSVGFPSWFSPSAPDWTLPCTPPGHSSWCRSISTMPQTCTGQHCRSHCQTLSVNIGMITTRLDWTFYRKHHILDITGNVSKLSKIKNGSTANIGNLFKICCQIKYEIHQRISRQILGYTVLKKKQIL